ncbi:MAG: hypothetical protein ABIG39_02555 [Candidatus Micrarchaeota archaeon]
MDVLGKTKYKGKETSEELSQPHADGFSIRGEAIESMDQIAQTLSSLKHLSVIPQGDSLAVLNVESRDIQKNPYLFSLIYLRKERMEVLYTFTPGMSPKKRRIDVIRFFLDIITLLQGSYKVDNAQTYQLVENTLKEMSEYISSSYDEIYAKHDAIVNEKKVLNKKATELRKSNDKLGKENIELKSKIGDLTLRVKDAETYSDEVLMMKIQQWIVEHKNEINVVEFSKIFRVSETRVEQVLKKMVNGGILEVRK